MLMLPCNDLRTSFPFLYFFPSPLLHNKEEQKRTSLLVELGYLNLILNLRADHALLAVLYIIILLKDGASIHISNLSYSWLNPLEINLLSRASRSPDLNPIEDVCVGILP